MESCNMPASPIVLEKQPGEDRLLNMSFSGQFASAAVVLASASILSIANLDGGSVTVSAGSVVWSGLEAQAMFTGGTAGDRYLVTWQGIGDNAERVEMEGVLVIVETG